MMAGFGAFGMFGGVWMIIFWGAFLWLIVWLVNKNKMAEMQNPSKEE